MVFTNTWNSAFEALPADTGENHALGANRIRALKNALRERFAIDHYMDPAGTDADHGEHSQVRFHANVATPANVASKSTLYPQTANGKLELFYKNNANQIVQITANGSVGVPLIPSNSKMLFYADSAPSGWTLLNTMDDKLVYVTKGSNAGGQTGAQAHGTGVWTISGLTSANESAHTHSHTHPVSGTAATSAAYSVGQMGVDFYPSLESHTHVVTGTATANTAVGTAHLHTVSQSGTWRPAAYSFIVCEKN